MATKADALSYLWTTLTQGSADAFVQASMATGLQGQTKAGYRIREVVLEGAGNSAFAQTGGTFEISCSRKSLAAMPVLTEKSLIAKWKWINSFTTSGLAVIQQTRREVFSDADNLIVVEDPFYWQLDSNGTSVASTVYVRVGYEIVTLSEVDRLTLIANSLQ